VTLKMPAFEWVHVQLHQQKGMISLSPPTICNSAVPCTIRSPVRPACTGVEGERGLCHDAGAGSAPLVRGLKESHVVLHKLLSVCPACKGVEVPPRH
ncbi:hypothetical protein EA146_15315, partial [Enterobacter hormaechei]